jgi:hypothetical protein
MNKNQLFVRREFSPNKFCFDPVQPRVLPLEVAMKEMAVHSFIHQLKQYREQQIELDAILLDDEDAETEEGLFA